MAMATREENILRVARTLGMSCPKIERCTMAEKGDNYMGELSFLRVSDSSGRVLDLVYKAASKSVHMREKAFVAEAFQNEALLYEEVVPMMVNFQHEKLTPQKFSEIGACYAARTEELNEYLIFENLNASGYTMWNRKVPMDRDHIVAVFKTYAKFHATTISLLTEKPEHFSGVLAKSHDILRKYCDDDSKLDGFNNMVQKIRNHYKDVFTNQDMFERFSKICANTRPIMKHMANLKTSRSVLLHGDCWCNNMLFKYTDSTKTSVADMKLIDWQMIRIGPAVCDLSAFLFACGSKEIFEDVDGLLEIYHETFTSHCESLGAQNRCGQTLNDLRTDWKRYASYSLIIAFIIIKVMVSDSDEAPNLSESAESGAEIVDAFDYESKHDAIYYERLGDVIEHCYKWGVI